MAAHSMTLLESMQTVHDKVAVSVDGVEKARNGEQLCLCIKNVEQDLKSWLSATILEAREQSNAAVTEVIHTQHKITTQALAELHNFHTASQQGNRQAVRDTKAEVMNMLTGMKSTLSEVLVKVDVCEKTCMSLVDDVSLLTSQGQAQAERTDALLASLQQTTLDTKRTLESQDSSDQTNNQEAVLAPCKSSSVTIYSSKT